jgi:guanylate kinase
MTTNSTPTTGRVVVISGPSGVGKSTICHRLCDLLPAEFSVSVTTRKPRPGEKNSRDYHYVAPEEFARMDKAGELLETAQVYGHQYGTPLKAVQQAVREGRSIILEIDIQGCIQVRRKMPDAVAIFLLPPTPEAQKQRIVGRNTDPAEAIRERLAKADGEIRFANESGCYDHFVVNDDLENTVQSVRDLILSRPMRSQPAIA